MSIPTQDSFQPLVGNQCQFNVLTTARSRRRKAAYSSRHVAYGNLNAVQTAGRLEAERALTLYVPSQAELDNLDQALGQQGTLSYGEGSMVALLIEFDSKEWVSSTEQTCTAVWITDAD
jgi:hypothetical protein